MEGTDDTLTRRPLFAFKLDFLTQLDDTASGILAHEIGTYTAISALDGQQSSLRATPKLQRPERRDLAM